MINTTRFFLRPLREIDITFDYLNWFNDPSIKNFINEKKPSLNQLKKYVKVRSNNENVLFLGIFTDKDKHIGNIKYEPIDTKHGYAIMGILIGDPLWRGKGVANEVFIDSARWLKKNRNINKVFLGVHKSNIAALKSYRKIGFKEIDSVFIKKKDKNHTTMMFDTLLIP